MKVKMNQEMINKWNDGLCPICGGHIEENLDEESLENGYTDFCYSCNSPIKVKNGYAYNQITEHYQY